MSLADTREAIGAVSQLLYDRLGAALNGLSIAITIGRPEAPAPSSMTADARLNLFLYRLELDGSLRNLSPDASLPTPLWLVLHYVMTAFDNSNDSDSIAAQKALGAGLRALGDLNFRGLYADGVAALSANPDRLKISLDEADPELLAKLVQNADGQFRLSAAFQVRPVMIAGGREPEADLLVGIDYSTDTVIGADGIRLPVLASLGPRIAALSPDSLEIGETLEISGRDLDAADLVIELGPAQLPVIAQRPDALRIELPDALGDGEQISAGSHALAVVQMLPGGRRRSSNLLAAALRPTLSQVQSWGLALSDPVDSASPVHGDVYLTGLLLGGDADDIQVTLYRPATPDREEVVRSFDSFRPLQSPPVPALPVAPQTWLRVSIPAGAPLAQGQYRVILRVNGQQAHRSPLLDLRLP